MNFLTIFFLMVNLPLLLSSAQLSVAQLSSAQLSVDQLRSARLGSAQLSSAQLSSAQLSSAQLGSAQLGSAQLGSAQLGSAQLSFAQLGSAQYFRKASQLSSTHLSKKFSPAQLAQLIKFFSQLRYSIKIFNSDCTFQLSIRLKTTRSVSWP